MVKHLFYLIIFLVWLYSSSTGVYAQQDANFTQFMFNTLYYNPGYAGVEGTTKITAMHRTQWAGYNAAFDGGGAPNTQIISLSAPALRYRTGVGFHAVNDQLGAVNNLEAQVSFAYHLGIRKSKMSFGMRAGIFSQAINFDKYRWGNPNDPLKKEGKDSQVRPDMAAGVFFQAEKYFAGLSFSHLLKSEFNFGLDSLRNPLTQHVTALFGYYFEYTYDFIITPSLFFRSDFNTFSIELNVLGTYKEKIWGGLSYRHFDAVSLMLGYSFFKDNSLKMGYAFDLTINAVDAKQLTSHEVMLSYTLPITPAGIKKVVRTPRFRYEDEFEKK